MNKRKVGDGKMAAHFENAEAARLFLESIRWPHGPVCPKCGSAKKPYATSKGKYRCSDKDCRSDFTVRVGTVFESSHVALHKWLLAAYLLCSSKKGMSSHQIHRTFGVTYKTAWFMTHRIREAMKDGGSLVPMGGPGDVVEIDETFIGHDKSKKPVGEKRGRGYAHKYKVLSLVDRKAKRAKSVVVDDLKMRTLRPILLANIHPDSFVMTDEASQYSRLDWHFARHDVVEHKSEEYVRYDKGRVITTNTVEGFFSIFKRGMKGVYQHCSERHLQRYLTEFDFRYNEREVTDAERTAVALRGSIGKRLKYRDSSSVAP
jgi:transposase-like protein